MLQFSIQKRLRDFTVKLAEQIDNEILVIIGHSGCGKSSTLRMLAGLVEPDEGRIELDGKSLFERNMGVNLPPEKRHIGFVFQNYALFPHLTVTENIAYGISELANDEKHQRISEVLSLLGLERLAHARPAMLSGGEQQRVAIARALVTRPKLLLFDEPLSALDISTRTRVRSELKDLLRALAIPSIVVTHDYEDARVLGDRIAVMDRGVIIQSGTANEIAQYPASDFVAEFTGTNLLPGKEAVDYVAVNPWHMELSRVKPDRVYIWQGKIRDMAWNGGFVRLHVEGEKNLLVDLPIDLAETAKFQTGETVYASVAEEYARMLVRPPHQVKDAKQQAGKYVPPAKRSRKWIWGAAFVAVALLAVACGMNIHAKETNGDLTAMIAANATDPFNEILSQQAIKAQTTFAGTQVLRTQLEHGAKADLFLSADLSHIEALQKEGLVDHFQPVSRGHEVIVVQKGNPKAIQTIADLADKPLKLIIGVDTVPIGKYTRMIFSNADKVYGNQFTPKTLGHVVSMESDVKQVLQKIALGEADAGIVYRTDVTDKFKDKVDLIEIPKSLNVESTNYIAVPNQAPHKNAGQSLMEYMLSPQGQAIFAKYGYDSLQTEGQK